MIRYLRGVRAKQVTAGGKHSIVLAPSGVVLCFGCNSYGQLGLGNFDLHPKLSPTVIERVNEMKTVDIACGSAHTLLLCLDLSGEKKVFACGLNSSGQLGLGHTHNVCSPTAICLPHYQHATLSSGPLSNHSFILCASKSVRRPSVPVLDLSTISRFVSAAECDSSGGLEAGGRSVIHLREAVAQGFCSPAVLSGSFLRTEEASCPFAPLAQGLNNWPDLTSLGKAYDLLLSNAAVESTLRRAALQCAQQLRHVPSDENECLNVFVSMLLNPLMLHPDSFHVALGLVILLLLICVQIAEDLV